MPASVPLVSTGILHVADDPEQAWAEAAPGIAYLEGNIASYSAPGPHPIPQASPALVREDYLVGTPEHVADKLVQLYRDVRFDHFAYWARLPGLSHDRALESLRMVASRAL